MSLTKNDLQAIGDLLDQKLEEKLESKLESKFQEKLSPIYAQLDEHSESLKYIKTKLNKTAKTVDIIARVFDERIVQNMKDIQLIKSHIGLPTKN